MSRLTATLLRCVSVSLLGLFAAAWTNTHGTSVVKIIVKEGDDVTLPCSMTTKKNLRDELFEWNKDGLQEVFLYDGGSHYGNGRPGQDPQYKGRVSHFEDQLQYGNASILIRNTQIDDRGIYTCVFPRPLPGREFHIKLVVGAAPPPEIRILNVTDDGVLLQCEVRGAHPRPELQWQAADGSVVPAQERQVSERGGRYDVTLLATVTRSAGNSFRCEVKQEGFHHVIHGDVTVPEKLFVSSPGAGFIIGGWFSGVVTVVVVLLIVLALFFRKRWKSFRQQAEVFLKQTVYRRTRTPDGPAVVNMVVNEGKDAILACSFGTRSIKQELFDWKKDDHQVVFTYNKGSTGQGQQFKGRVFHFPDHLKSGNASIVIRNTKVTDSGSYTCDFPFHRPNRRSHIKLVVDPGEKENSSAPEESLPLTHSPSKEPPVQFNPSDDEIPNHIERRAADI